MKPTLLTALLTVLLVNVASAEAPVWKVSDEQYTLYIGGTIHVLDAGDYPLPEAFERAYRAADRLVFEADMQSAGTLGFQQRLLEAALYTDGSNLASHLRPDTLERLRDFMHQRGIPLETVLPFRVGMLVTLLTVNELQRQGIQGRGVDQFFNDRAVRDGKPVSALETLEQQIRFVAQMGTGEENQIVLQTLEQLEDFAHEFEQLKAAWREGDTAQLEAIALDDFKAFPAAYASMLVDRNRAWMPQIQTMLANREIEYLLVGVLHLVGPDSVLAMLEEQGYRVERLH